MEVGPVLVAAFLELWNPDGTFSGFQGTSTSDVWEFGTSSCGPKSCTKEETFLGLLEH